MEKEAEKREFAVADVGKAAAGFLNKAKTKIVNSVDQNGDGEISLEDVNILADTVKMAVKDGNEKWAKKIELTKREKDLKTLRPIFEADIEKPDFSLPKLIRVAKMDQKHAESQVCQNSVGHFFTGKELDVLTIYSDRVSDFDLKFYPDMDSEVYYVDPADRDHYIALDDYYNYLKIARIGELQKIAQDLGAKHFRVTYKEQNKSVDYTDDNIKVKGKIAKYNEGLGAEHHAKNEKYAKIEIAAEMVCIGHKPTEPVLVYFKKDPQIQNLVALRMSDNEMTHQVYTLDLSNSSGIKVKDAAKIDASLSAMKVEGNFSISSEAQKEAHRIFEYEIDF